ncbi:nuclear transport factor 2 family protein [candidate division KSB1 bacterium]|nr:nuclear transport factor 2 family protein [candidate division KSB1 bacterium]
METKKIEQEKIKDILKNVNIAWSSGNPEDLMNYFHDNMLIISPDMKILGYGKENCIKSYIDFLNQATIIDYQKNVPEIHIFENTAIVFYTYNISWKTNNKLFNEKGKEIYVLNKHKNKWLIVMRKIASKL